MTCMAFIFIFSLACPTGVLSAEILFSQESIDVVISKCFKDYGVAALKSLPLGEYDLEWMCPGLSCVVTLPKNKALYFRLHSLCLYSLCVYAAQFHISQFGVRSCPVFILSNLQQVHGILAGWDS